MASPDEQSSAATMWIGQRFPAFCFNPGNSASIACRVGAFAEYILSHLDTRGVGEAPSLGLKYLAMLNKRHGLQFRESLLSVARTWSAYPDLVVLSDGSWRPAELENGLEWWPNRIQVREPWEVWKVLLEAGQKRLVELSRKHPLSLKLAFVLTEALTSRVIFVDSDVLWLADPVPRLKEHRWMDGVAVSVEPGGSFNLQLAKAACPEILCPPFANTGCILLEGQLFASWKTLDGLLTLVSDSAHEFNEQTVFAIAAKQHGQYLPPDFLINDFAEPQRLKPLYLDGSRGLARHYVRFMRHLLYRDALLLRIRTAISP
jgi:hypothetical protein